MDNYFNGFSRQEVCVILDALASYIENEKARQEKLSELSSTLLQRLEKAVIASQFDESKADERDTVFSSYTLVCRKSDIAGAYNREAKVLYGRFLKYLEGNI